MYIYMDDYIILHFLSYQQKKIKDHIHKQTILKKS